MTRNYIFLFLFILLVASSLLIGIFGPHGLVVNRALENNIDVQQHRLDGQLLKLQNLKNRMADVWTEQSLLDSARSIGYVQPGESVYFFFDGQGNPIPTRQTDSFSVDIASITDNPDSETVKGLSFLLIILISIVFSTTIVTVVAFLRNRNRSLVILKFDEESVYVKNHRKQ